MLPAESYSDSPSELARTRADSKVAFAFECGAFQRQFQCLLPVCGVQRDCVETSNCKRLRVGRTPCSVPFGSR